MATTNRHSVDRGVAPAGQQKDEDFLPGQHAYSVQFKGLPRDVIVTTSVGMAKVMYRQKYQLHPSRDKDIAVEEYKVE